MHFKRVRVDAGVPLVPSAGVKRIAGAVYQEMRQTLASFVTGVVHDAITMAEHCRRMTITVNDMLLVLKRRNMYDDLRALLRPASSQRLALPGLPIFLVSGNLPSAGTCMAWPQVGASAVLAGSSNFISIERT